MSGTVIVIGGGPGGYAAAIYCARLGQRVTLIERAELGGTCLNAGCIPTKAFVQAAHTYRLARGMAGYGIVLDGDIAVDFEKTAGLKNRIVKQQGKGVAGLLKKAGVEVVGGYGRLKGARSVEVLAAGAAPRELTADAIVLASGSSEINIPGFEPDGISVLNSSQMLDITTLPESTAIIGGGVIGVEFASILSGFGKKVSIVEMTPSILPLEDADISAALAEALTRQGVEILISTNADHVVSKGADAVTMALRDAGGALSERTFDKVLVCVGRRPNIDGLGLDTAGIAYNNRFIETNDRMLTNVPDIYAIGDLTASPQLAHVGYYEAKIAALNIAGKEAQADYTAIPTCVFSHPEISRVGLTETMARERYDNVGTRLVTFAGNGKAMIEGETEGFVKIVYCTDNNKLLGFSILGPRATELIPEPTLALRLKLPVNAVADTIHAHPSLSEILNEVSGSAGGLGLHA